MQQCSQTAHYAVSVGHEAIILARKNSETVSVRHSFLKKSVSLRTQHPYLLNLRPETVRH